MKSKTIEEIRKEIRELEELRDSGNPPSDEIFEKLDSLYNQELKLLATHIDKKEDSSNES